MTAFCQFFLGFALYSMMGWACESVYCSIGARKWINRGFLNGPVCPVYGFGAMIVVTLLTPYQHSIPLLFLAGMAATSALEYLTGWLLETLFHTKWWDYSTYRFNLHGRVCLRNSLMFGALSVLAMRVINPFVLRLVGMLEGGWLVGVAFGTLAVFACDTFITVRAILELDGKLEQLHTMAEDLRNLETQRLESLKVEIGGRWEEAREERAERRSERKEAAAEALLLAADSLRQRRNALQQRSKLIHKRLIRAFPTMQPHDREQDLQQMKEALLAQAQARKTQKAAEKAAKKTHKNG